MHRSPHPFPTVPRHSWPVPYSCPTYPTARTPIASAPPSTSPSCPPSPRPDQATKNPTSVGAATLVSVDSPAVVDLRGLDPNTPVTLQLTQPGALPPGQSMTCGYVEPNLVMAATAGMVLVGTAPAANATIATCTSTHMTMFLTGFSVTQGVPIPTLLVEPLLPWWAPLIAWVLYAGCVVLLHWSGHKLKVQSPPDSAAEFAELLCRIVGFLDSSELCCRFIGFPGFCRFVLPICWGFWDSGILGQLIRGGGGCSYCPQEDASVVFVVSC